MDRFLADAQCLPNLSSIEVQARALLSDTLSVLFDLPSCRHLRCLSVDGHYFKPKHLRQLVAHCPQLHSVHLSQMRSLPLRFVDLLPTLPSLRSLHLVHTRAWVQCTHGDTMAAGHLCLHLRVSDAATLTRFTRWEAFVARVAVLDVFFEYPQSTWGLVLGALPALHTLCVSADFSGAIARVLHYSSSIRTIEFVPWEHEHTLTLIIRLWTGVVEATRGGFVRSAVTSHAPPLRLLVRWPRAHTDESEAAALLSHWRAEFERLVRPPSDDCPVHVVLVDHSAEL